MGRRDCWRSSCHFCVLRVVVLALVIDVLRVNHYYHRRFDNNWFEGSFKSLKAELGSL